MIWNVIMALAVTLMASASPGDGKQGDMLFQLKRHEIQVLLKAGFSPSDVASRSGASEDTVRRIGVETEVRHTDDAVARKDRRVGRPSEAAPFGARVSSCFDRRRADLSVEVRSRASPSPSSLRDEDESGDCSLGLARRPRYRGWVAAQGGPRPDGWSSCHAPCSHREMTPQTIR